VRKWKARERGKGALQTVRFCDIKREQEQEEAAKMKQGDLARATSQAEVEVIREKLGGEEYEAVKSCLESQSMQFKQQVRELHVLSRRQFNIMSPYLFYNRSLDEETKEDMVAFASKDSGVQVKPSPSQNFEKAAAQASSAKVANVNWWQDPMKVFGMHSPPLMTNVKEGSMSSSKMESTVIDSTHPSLYSSGLGGQRSIPQRPKSSKRSRDSLGEDSNTGLQQPACPAPKKATPQSAAGILLALSETPCQTHQKKSKTK